MTGHEGGDIPARVSMLVLSTGDMRGLRTFYRALGWSERPGSSDALSTFDLEHGLAIALHPQALRPEADEDLSDLRDHDAAEAPSVGRDGITAVIRVDAREFVDPAFEAALSAGARSLIEPQDQPWGGRSALFADPDGNQWELLWFDRALTERTSPRR
ncbi:MAG TPA: VOC family protein [Acidimicrobiales bacterium]|nr:VOC family protein [Acidimicrobiales bacterium]